MFKVSYSNEHYVTLFEFNSLEQATSFACALFPSVVGSIFISSDGKTLCSFHHKKVESSVQE